MRTRGKNAAVTLGSPSFGANLSLLPLSFERKDYNALRVESFSKPGKKVIVYVSSSLYAAVFEISDTWLVKDWSLRLATR